MWAFSLLAEARARWAPCVSRLELGAVLDESWVRRTRVALGASEL